MSAVLPLCQRDLPEHAMHILVQLDPGSVPLLHLRNEIAECSGHNRKNEQHRNNAQCDIGQHKPECPRVTHNIPPASAVRICPMSSRTIGMAADRKSVV